MLIVTSSIQIPDSELQWSFARSGGPGGQNVNKVSSKAILDWSVTTTPSLPEPVRERLMALSRRRITKNGRLQIIGQRFRDQGKNIEDCRNRLIELIRAATIVPTKRKASTPSRASKQRRLQDKRVRSDRKQQRRSPSRGD